MPTSTSDEHAVQLMPERQRQVTEVGNGAVSDRSCAHALLYII